MRCSKGIQTQGKRHQCKNGGHCGADRYDLSGLLPGGADLRHLRPAYRPILPGGLIPSAKQKSKCVRQLLFEFTNGS